jgi:RND superfamily putative drug exporter
VRRCLGRAAQLAGLNDNGWPPLRFHDLRHTFASHLIVDLGLDVAQVSRVRERFRQTGDNSDAIAQGVGSTGRIITGAALIIIAVLSGFARGDLVMFQQMGFGVAVALLLDATVVRLVLVPVAMKLLGECNWYLPTWLRWLPDVHVEGSERRRGASPVTARQAG